MLLVLAALAATAAAPTPALATNQATVAEITRLETRGGEAVVKRDFAFLETIVAPEYTLAYAAPQGQVSFIRRPEWMSNTRLWFHEGFDVHVIDVTTAGDTAIATIEGLWTVKRNSKPGEPVRFVATDTWVRHHGQWQIAWRFSQRLPGAPWPMLPPKK